MSQERNALPIDAIRPAFDATPQDRPLVVVAPTGSGKSTRLPLWMEAQVQGQVLVVEPRRVACRALATYLAKLRGEPVGKSIGYQVRFESRMSADTRVLFVTPGMALRLLGSESQPRWAACLVDEFHERHWEVDLLVALLLHRQRTVSSGPDAALWLVLTSATIAGGALAERIGASSLEAEGRSFPVSISHTDGPSAPGIQGVEDRVAATVLRVLRQAPDAREDILVFLPGKGEIEGCLRALEGAVSSMDVALLPVHGSLPMEQLSRAFAAEAPVRRVYLSTNVAETSLTLPRVTTVIDTGLVRMRLHRSGRSALALVPVTHSQMEQRAGRAGRVAPGHCIRLWDASFLPSQDIRPELERIELDDLVLQAAIHGLDGDQVAEAPWVTPPPDFAVAEAQKRLQGIEALDDARRLTPFGRSLASWPLSAIEASLVVGAPAPLASALADLVALLQQHGSLFGYVGHLSPERREEVAEARRALLDHCQDEVTAALLLLRKGEHRRHVLHQSRLEQARAISRQLRRKMGLHCPTPTKDETPLPTANALAAWLLSRAPDLGFVRRKRADAKPKGRARRERGPTNPAEPWGNGEIELMVDPHLPTDPDQKRRIPKAGVILAHTWLGGRGLRVQGRGRMLLPCRPEILAEAGLGELQVEAPKAKRRKGRLRIEADVTTTLAGIPLSSESQVLAGEALRQAVTRLMLEGRFWPERMARLLDALHVLQLLSAWPPPKEWGTCTEAKGWLEDPAAYLQNLLTTLGLEAAEELELLEAEDLLPDTESLLGIDAYTLADFARDFPRQWEFHGAIYHCHVSPTRRKVRIEPRNKQARQGKDPAARLLPGFRGFQIDYQKASRVVKLR